MLNLYLFFFVLIAEPNGSVRRRLAWNCWPRLETMRPSSGFTAVPRPIWAPGHTRPPLPPNRPTGPRPPRSISITARQPLQRPCKSLRFPPRTACINQAYRRACRYRACPLPATRRSTHAQRLLCRCCGSGRIRRCPTAAATAASSFPLPSDQPERQ